MVDSLKMFDAVNAYNKATGMTGIYEAEEASKAPDFTQMVEAAISETKQQVVAAEEAVQGSITGDVSIEQLAIAVANAETSLKAMVSIRDKIITAYQEIIRMPI